MMISSIRGLGISLFALALFVSIIPVACGKKEEPQKPALQQSIPSQTSPAKLPTADTTTGQLSSLPPKMDSYFVLDNRSNSIYGIDLNNNKVSAHLARTDQIVAIQYDALRNWIYEAVAEPSPGLDIYDVAAQKYLQKLRFPGAPSALMYHPIQQKLYMVSEDSTNFRVFDPDSMNIVLTIPLNLQERAPISPHSLGPGPMGKLITSNSAHPSVTQILTEHHFMYQTVIIHNADQIDDAVFAFDGNSSFSCDTKQGAIFRVEFGTGKVLAEKYQLKQPRLIQIEVLANTLVFVEGNTEVVMLNPDTFRETGRVDLSEYGDKILSLIIPPKANYAELLLDYKGVTRWMRFDIQNWEQTRLVELL